LVRADSYGDYDGIELGGFQAVVGLIPAGGWRVEYTEQGGAVFSEPLVGWAVKANGFVSPMVTSSEGEVDFLDLPSPVKYRIYHPDSTTRTRDP
jgi:hypothetical protein